MLNLPTGVMIAPIAEHSIVKSKLLYLIEDVITDYPQKTLNPVGYRFDFDLSLRSDYKPGYRKILHDTVHPYLKEYARTLGMGVDRYSPQWFQQYTTGTSFGWHQHNMHFAYIYYLELPDPDESTEFLQYGRFNVQEGDLLVFPSWFVHRSADIKSDKRKTILAGNVEFKVDRELIKINYEDR